MIKEAKTKEEFEDIKAEYCDMPAPLDNKNLSTDWIAEEFFDDVPAIGEHGKYCGYLENNACEVVCEGNQIMITFIQRKNTTEYHNIVKERLSPIFDDAFNDEQWQDCIAIIKSYSNHSFEIYFYWTKEEIREELK